MRIWHLEALDRLPRVGSWWAVAGAMLAVLLSMLIRAPLESWLGVRLPAFITFSPAIVIASLLGGIRIGLLAVAVCTASAWMLSLAPSGDWRVSDDADVVAAGLFFLVGSFLAFVSGSSRLLLDEVRANARERYTAAREAVHRIKNLIAVTHALLRRSASQAPSVQALEESLSGRLQSLARAQEMLIRRQSESARLDEIVKQALLPFEACGNLHITPGPDAEVDGAHVAGLSLALYELATNSLKYGVLGGSADGRVDLGWSRQGDRVVLTWREQLSAPVQRDHAGGQGFGLTLIRAAFGGDPRTRTECKVSEFGVECAFEWTATRSSGD